MTQRSSLRADGRNYSWRSRRKPSPGRWGSWVRSGLMRSTSCRQPTRRCDRPSRSSIRCRQVLLNDAVTIPGVAIPQVPIIKGDAKSVSIAAASILAKVTRDHMMEEYDKDYPEYGFAKHKGYGTPAHITALKEFGPTPIHRRTFITKFV